MHEHKSGQDERGVPEALSSKETLVILLIVIGIIPWAFVWVLYLAPAFGLGGLPMKFHILFVVGGPGLLWALLHWLFFRE